MLDILILLSFVIKVHVYKVPIKIEPDFFSTNLAIVSFGEKLEADTLINGWYRVKYNDKTGYVHNTAARRFKGISLSNTQNVAEENEDAISLAAKGFADENKNVNSGYDIIGVEYLEGFNIKEDSIRSFKEEGEL